MGQRKSLKRLSSLSESPSRAGAQPKRRSSSSANAAPGSPDLFKYTPLDASQQHIRILRISSIVSAKNTAGSQPEPASASQTIRAYLIQTPLYELPHFVALSYTWGGQTKKASLLVDDEKLPITENLQEALIHLYNADILHVWADAVCINQDNPEEKASQIQRLSTIFRAADRVISWIGTHDEHTRFVFEFIGRNRGKDIEMTKNAAEELDVALTALSKRPYWTRLWILQEFSVAAQLQIMCGNDLEDVETIENLVSQFVGQSERGVHEMTPFRHMWTRRRWYRAGASVGLLEMLILTTSNRNLFHQEVHRVFHSTDIIDQIYGLLGLVNDGTLFVLEPDYTIRHINRLFIRMTRFFVRTSKQLDVCFLECGKRAAEFGNPGMENSRSYSPEKLPVWCPDYLNLVESAQNTELINSFDCKQETPMKLLGPRYRYSKESHCWHASASSRLTTGSYSLNDTVSMGLKGKLLGTIDSPSDWTAYIPSSTFVCDANVSCPSWLSALLFAYASEPAAPLTQIVEALSFILSDIKCFLGCCDEERARLKKRLTAGELSDDLAPLITKSTMSRGKSSSVSMHTVPSDEIHQVAFSIATSVLWNYRFFERKVAVYNANKEDEHVLDSVAKHGAFGWVPASAQAGDEIWLLEGCSMPLVLRRTVQPATPDVGTFIKVGPAVINGAMRGEMWSRDSLIHLTITKATDPTLTQPLLSATK